MDMAHGRGLKGLPPGNKGSSKPREVVCGEESRADFPIVLA